MTTRIDKELRLHRFLARLRSRLSPGKDVDQVARSALREASNFFEADSGCLSKLDAGAENARVVFHIPDSGEWDLELLTRFHREQRPKLSTRVLLSPIYRRGRTWRVMGLSRHEREFEKGSGWPLTDVTGVISEIIQQIDRDRITEVRSRIERKIMEELRPKDLFYDILHGLRTLTGYDHSSAVLISGEQGDSLELVAEQIAWHKGKSERIGLRLPIDAEVRPLLAAGEIYGFERTDDGWVEWTERGAAGLAALLDYSAEPAAAEHAEVERAMLCAPIATKEGVVGVLKVAMRHSGGLGPYEAELLRRFVPQVSVAIQNSRRNESLRHKILEAEKRNAVADVARGVAHDVNNALGSILPLVQQLREECTLGELDPKRMAQDLDEIERSVQVCRRIFGGMLAFARGTVRGPGRGSVHRAIDGALAILEDGMARRGIRCQVDAPETLPMLPCRQGDLEQVFLNLLSNARDAMPGGGKLTVHVAAQDAHLAATIEDTGCGIPDEDLRRIGESFFTTKPQGNGLGLSICRSILWSMRGRMKIHSRVDEGTRVEIVLPCDDAVDPEDTT